MSDTEKSTTKSDSLKHRIVGASYAIGVVGLLGIGGYAGWSANDALGTKPGTTTANTVLSSSTSPTTSKP